LANAGKRVDLDPILRITDFTGKVYYEKGVPESSQIVDPGIAFILSDILADNAARTAAFGPNSALVIPQKTVAVKTGTTNEKRDNLTIGYTPSVVVSVWVGNMDNSPMHPTLTSGVTGAAPIWNQIMTHVLRSAPNEPFRVPEGVVSIPCFGRQEYFLTGSQPRHGCGTFPSPLPSAPEGKRV
jgi:membrane peptidoglycan carboxypeptidase